MLSTTRKPCSLGQAQRAQRLEIIGSLASGVAHDFNNLLTVILNLTHVAGSKLPANHAIQHDLRRISEASTQAAHLAKQLLAMGRQGSKSAGRVDLNRLVRRTVDLLRGTLSSGIKMDLDLGVGEPAVHANEVQLQQVLMNLCLNARDAMPAGGRLRVQTTIVPDYLRDATDTRDWVMLSVEDQGEGMTENLRARIFDSFFTTKADGTGLGLAIVRQIVESYGGRIEVCSHPGIGSRFDVWLPVA